MDVVVEGRIDDRRHDEHDQHNITLILTYRIDAPSFVVGAIAPVPSAAIIVVVDVDDDYVAYGVF
jgi:hypothetical protein